MTAPRHPIQPVIRDARGTVRFKGNPLVQHLLDNGGIDMNKLFLVEASSDDRQQFAQLIGYSVDGYGTLGYSDDAIYEAAQAMARDGLTAEQAQIQELRTKLAEVKEGLRHGVARLFDFHPDDLLEDDE